jgi:hypothetical protein
MLRLVAIGLLGYVGWRVARSLARVCPEPPPLPQERPWIFDNARVPARSVPLPSLN